MSSGPIDELIAHLSRLPGVGERTATRLAFFLLRSKPQFRSGFAQALNRLSEIVLCRQCRTLTQQNPCSVCASPIRNHKLICVVEKASDIYPIERLNAYRGVYFVLHGLLSPMEGIGPEDIGLHQLTERVQNQGPDEIILALNPTVEGDATSSYLVKLLEKSRTEVTRLASGLPIGSELEYADQITLGKAFEGRTRVR